MASAEFIMAKGVDWTACAVSQSFIENLGQQEHKSLLLPFMVASRCGGVGTRNDISYCIDVYVRNREVIMAIQGQSIEVGSCCWRCP